MKKIILTAAIGAASLTVAACNDSGNNAADANMAGDAEGALVNENDGSAGANAAGGAAAGDWPRGARVVEEGGVTYRVDPNGTRVRIEDGTRIVTENGVRYRVSSSGTRVRINEQGLDVDLDGPDIPGVDVDIGTNRKGNLDIDVNTSGGDATPDR